MKEALSPKTIAIVIAVVIAIIIVAAFMVFKPSSSAPVVPVPYKRPGSSGYGPGGMKGGGKPVPGAPMPPAGK